MYNASHCHRHKGNKQSLDYSGVAHLYLLEYTLSSAIQTIITIGPTPWEKDSSPEIWGISNTSTGIKF